MQKAEFFREVVQIPTKHYKEKSPKIQVEQNFLFEIFKMEAILSRENPKNDIIFQ